MADRPTGQGDTDRAGPEWGSDYIVDLLKVYEFDYVSFNPGASFRGLEELLVYLKQREQEELYVPLDGPGQLRIDDENVEVPVGSAVRVSPETPRQPINETERQYSWLILGAPKVPDDGIYVEDDE